MAVHLHHEHSGGLVEAAQDALQALPNIGPSCIATDALVQAARHAGFVDMRPVIEIRGHCAACA